MTFQSSIDEIWSVHKAFPFSPYVSEIIELDLLSATLIFISFFFIPFPKGLLFEIPTPQELLGWVENKQKIIFLFKYSIHVNTRLAQH